MAKIIRSNKLVGVIPWLAALAVAGCILDEEAVVPTNMDLTVDASAKAVGEDFSFTYDAQGTALNRVVVEFGDGSHDSDTTFFGAFQSATMSGVMVHSYDSTGTFTVVGWVEDLAVGADTVELTVTVN
jgi:hypothetical protein